MQKDNMNPTHQKLNILDKKLIGYSLAAGVILAGGETHAEVQYSGIFDLHLYPGYFVYFDFGPASSGWEYITNLSTYYARVRGSWSFNLGNAYTSLGVKPFNSLEVIGDDENFWQSYIPLSPLFAGIGKKYIGVEFNSSLGVHYGWVGVTVYTPPYPNDIILHDWAWEDVPGRFIQAGSQVSLSVALTGFTAAVESDAVVLAWTTQSEVDNLGFALERCDMDGEGNLLSDWVEIASYLTHPELEGRGNTSEASEYKISDPNVEMGKFYGYRLIDVDAAGNRQVHNLIQVEVTSTLPEDMVLLQNFPNPFNPATTIEFSVPEQDNVTLSIYNLKGQTVDVLVNEQMSAGPHYVSWDGSDQPAGVYFYELRTGSHHEIRKLMLVK
ncbi:T9SS type A sorting domain-containing protein [candidate division KSB1 bacterium]|nr:T9SS type A sorting domain-containing protein [candidate division KSB1 bacterium]